MSQIRFNEDLRGQKEPKGLDEAIFELKNYQDILNHFYYRFKIDAIVVIPRSEPNINDAIIKAIDQQFSNYSRDDNYDVYVVFNLDKYKKDGELTFLHIDEINFEELEIPEPKICY